MKPKLYPPQDPHALEPHFGAHMLAITAERLLDSKAGIAEQLAWRDKRIAELEQRLEDIDTLDAHVRTLHGGSFWSSSEDSCGVTDPINPADNWHRHGADENQARHEAAERIRSTQRCDWMSGWGSRCRLPAGHSGEGHLVSAGGDE